MAQMAVNDDDLLTTGEVADYFRTSKSTVYGWNSSGTGPRRIRVGKRCLYRRGDVRAFLEGHVVKNDVA